jgi:hypothetical protein
MLSALALCACAHVSADSNQTSNSVKEKPVMTTTAAAGDVDQGGTPPIPALTAEQGLLRLLELIRSSKGTQDFTPERLNEVMGVRVEYADDGADRYGTGGQLTEQWSYGFGVEKTAARGMRFEFSFNENVPGSSPPMTEICQIDFDRFTAELEAMGFTRQRSYGSHGSVMNDFFDRPGMRVSVYPRGEANEPPEKISHSCVQMVLI